jgi:Leucine-rich repeat (LRR) protein
MQMCCAGLACAQALVVLNASKNQLAELPGDLLAAWLALRELDVSSNQLTVGTACRYLVAACTGMLKTFLYKTIAATSSTMYVHMQQTQTPTTPQCRQVTAHPVFLCLQALPAAVGSLPRLSLLDVRSNQLCGLPAELGRASSLVELKAGFNRLQALPDTLGMLVNMKTLDVRNNLLQVWQRSAVRCAGVQQAWVC